jgi:hypothetical protein
LAPFFVLVIAVAAFWLAGRAGVAAFQDPGFVLRAALGLMFFLPASAHWGKRRPDLIRMVPPASPRPDLLVTLTGVLEILGANRPVRAEHGTPGLHLFGSAPGRSVPSQYPCNPPALDHRRSACAQIASPKRDAGCIL